MTKSILAAAFLLGAAAILWMAAIFVGADALALTITLVIGGAYLLGFVELLHFRQATLTLSNALNTLPAQLNTLQEWINKLHPSLQNSVQLRIEGERVGLPAPVVTPYLVGLLVMLGLLGTFVGMVDTLQGAVVALEGNNELQAIRAGLAAPIKGLGLAFGTSVAGVAASAMLGLMSTLCRRERILETRRLDQHIAGTFREFSLIHNRQQTYQALQMQAHALPAIADKLGGMAEKLEQMGERLSNSLTTNQEQFHQSIESRYTELARSVDESLQASVAQSSRLTVDSIHPIMKEAMTDISASIKQSTESTQQQLSTVASEQLDTITTQFNRDINTWLENQSAGDEQRLGQFTKFLQQAQEQATVQQSTTVNTVIEELTEFNQQQKSTSATLLGEINKLMSSSDDLIQMRLESESTWLDKQQQRMDTFGATLTTQLTALGDQEERRSNAAVERLASLESTVTEHLATLGKELEAPMTRLIETASETPRAAAEVIGHLRREISNNIERDNQLLEERRLLMEQLTTLSTSLTQSSAQQREMLEQLVVSSATMLNDVGAQFTDQVDSESEKLSGIVTQFAGSAAEMASLGDSFGVAVQQFNDSNSLLVTTLSHIEESLEQSSTRSDEQLGYYVAQAREIIDHSILSQKQMIEELRQLGQQEDLFAEAVS